MTPTIVKTVRVFYLSHNQTPQDVQGIIDQLRTTATQRIYHFNAQKAVAIAGPPSRSPPPKASSGSWTRPGPNSN